MPRLNTCRSSSLYAPLHTHSLNRHPKKKYKNFHLTAKNLPRRSAADVVAHYYEHKVEEKEAEKAWAEQREEARKKRQEAKKKKEGARREMGETDK